jgi:hypothetical protein
MVGKEIRFFESEGIRGGGVNLQLTYNYPSTIALSSIGSERAFSAAYQICTKIIPTSVIKTNLLMFYKAKVAVCSEIRTKHLNAMWAPRRIF